MRSWGVGREGRIPGLKRGQWGVTPGLGAPERPEGSGGQSSAARRGGLFHIWAVRAQVSS